MPSVYPLLAQKKRGQEKPRKSQDFCWQKNISKMNISFLQNKMFKKKEKKDRQEWPEPTYAAGMFFHFTAGRRQ